MTSKARPSATAVEAALNPYLPLPVRIESVHVETDDAMLKTFDVAFANPGDAVDFDFVPGQFCEISVFGKGEAPFGIASSPTEPGPLKFTVNKAGVLTTALHQMEEGEVLGLRGPLGNGFPLDVFEGHNLVIIGGGFAFTTLRSLTAYILHGPNRDCFKDVTIIYGARRPGLLLYKEDLAAWEQRKDISVHLTIDSAAPEWTKHVGFVPDVVEKVAPKAKGTYAVICGPPIMIRFTMPKLTALGFPPERIYSSLERRMKCGIGKCGRCNIGPYYVCKDGPVFSYAQLEGKPREF
ncbi:MAG: heterodisulfide reductase subunit F [Anaerolineae bacterium SM23_84]|nr:MAG: heterodisulfide reductase subunit F [Anaerolineae bacterium SM23_84]